MRTRLLVLVVVASSIAALAADGPRIDETFFNGKDLTGWSAPAPYWSVQDGAIVGHIDMPVPQNEFIWSSVEVKDFYLAVDVKLDPNDHNGGIQFRSQKKPPNEALGYQADMGKAVWGRLYHESGRQKLDWRERGEAAVRPGEWNHYEILAVGHRIWTALNGKLAVSVNDPQGELSGYIALQMHEGPPLTARYKIIKLVHDPKVELIGLNEEQLNAELIPPDDAKPKTPQKPAGKPGAGKKKGAAATQPGGAVQAEKRFSDSSSASGQPVSGFTNGRFDLGDGEAVIFAGQTNAVRAQQTPYLESLLAVQFAEHKPRFRSMAWEGDTVYQQWRDMNFGGWYDQLAWSGAGVVIAQFGQTESLDGVARLDAFVAAYGKMIDEFHRATHRIVLISPMLFEKPDSPLVPDHTAQNAAVQAYADAIRKLAAQRACIFVDLVKPQSIRKPGGALTSNGMHLNDFGQRVTARFIAEQLGVPQRSEEALQPLRQAIVEKNQLWFENWRPMNWAFAYGDRVTQPFGQPGGGRPALRIEYEEFKPLVAKADQAIHELAHQAKLATK